MFSIFELFAKTPNLKNIDLKRYHVDYSLNRLIFGVDNIHFDVYISQQVCNTLKRTASLLMIKHSRSEHFFKDYKRESCEIEKDALRRVCTDILLDGISRAKSVAEVQIDFLGQAALAKMFLAEIKEQYKTIVTHLESLIRIYQLSKMQDQNESFKIKDKLTDIKIHQNQIIRLVGEELFSILADIQVRNLRNMRETHFLAQDILPDDFFINPILHTDNPSDDFFLIEEYVLLGQRSEDPDNYQSVKQIINELLGKTDLRHLSTQGFNLQGENKNDNRKDDRFFDARENLFDSWMKEPDNVELMFNCFDSQEQYVRAKAANYSQDVLLKLKEQTGIQQKLLNLFYRKFSKSHLLRQIVAAFEMKSVYGNYCPPLAPRQIREFLVDFWSRKSITRQLKRRTSLHGKALTLTPLQQTVKRIRGCTIKEKKQYLLMFLKQISRYHRALYNCRILREAMDSISLVTEEKIILLSRGNRSLFEFLIPAERGREESPVSNHVIMKADIRGSMDINHIMRTRGLNPASYFSLNFFDPISAILFEYDAAKVFIEGDAIILSIFESQDSPQGSYSVARACGLAIRILQIVQRYNVKNKENNLPILELGIGICASAGPPAYLFDGDSKIMISPAINMADRLSSCDKKLRKRFKDQNRLFNLYVFKNAAEEEITDTADDFSLRYNVNGIELSIDGFTKLTSEINLTAVNYPVNINDNAKIYKGKVPTLTGNYQRLAIREATIYEVKPETMDVIGETSKKYYEVCTQQEIYDFIDNQP